MQIFETAKVDRSGFYRMIARDYHADPCPAPSLSSSLARTLVDQSPLHAWTGHPRLNPDFEESTSNRLDKGKVAHAILLETEVEELVIVDAHDFRTKEAREQRDKATNAGMTAICAPDYEAIKVMVGALRRQLESVKELPECLLGKGAHRELTACLEYNGIWLRTRMDWFWQSPEKIIIGDYKTTEASAEAGAVSRRIGEMGYDIQLAFYRFILRQLIDNCPPIEAYIVTQEMTAPYAASVVRLTDEYFSLGSKVATEAMSRWKHALTNDEWPCYPPLIADALPPSFIENRRLEAEQNRVLTMPFKREFHDVEPERFDANKDQKYASTVMA